MRKCDTLLLRACDLEVVTQAVGIHRLMLECIDRIRQVIGGEGESGASLVETPPRAGFSYTRENGELGLLEWMPARKSAERATVKVVGYHPSNPDSCALPSILSTISRYELETGRLVALADATFLTALRTGAASAAMTDVLARSDAVVLGIVGCGAQAVTQIHGISHVRDVRKILAYDTDSTAAESLQERLPFFSGVVTVLTLAELPLLMAESNIICTCTSQQPGAGPVIPDAEIRPGLHINAVGSDFPDKVELPLGLLRRGVVCPDFREQAMAEGECQMLEPGEIGPTMRDVLSAPASFAYLREALTVFDSTGWALEDDIAMDVLIGHALCLGAYIEVALEHLPKDPKNPYSGLWMDRKQSSDVSLENAVLK
ncbi:MAG: hypothetical protein R3F19_11375 [Verrucomicrobiales bacterium]